MIIVTMLANPYNWRISHLREMSQTIQSDRKTKVLSCLAAFTTTFAGIIHLSLVHPTHSPLQEFGIFFLVSGIAQVFWIIPVIRDWHKAWHYIGIIGTAVLIAIWSLSRFSTLITPRPFHVDQMGIIEESMQVAFIVLLAVILIFKSRTNKIDSDTPKKKNKDGLLILAGIVVAIILVGLFVPIPFGQPMGPPPQSGGPPGQFGGPSGQFSGPPQFGSSPQQSTTQTSATNMSCTLTPSLIEEESTPQQTEGPYFVDEMLDRSDIRSDPSDGTVQDGVPLHLLIHVYTVNHGSCIPFTGAHVDIWHANSQGLYSDIAAINTLGKKYLRGYQVTDDNGAVQFTTIYPGWYQGRALHIHIKVRTFDGTQKTSEWTSQFYFNDTITDQVHSQPPYNNHGQRDTLNNEDSIYTGPSTDGMYQSNTGTHLMLNLTKDGQGYLGTFNVVVNTSQTS